MLYEFVTIFPELTGNVLSAEVKLYLLYMGLLYSSCLSGHLGFLSRDGCLILTNQTGTSIRARGAPYICTILVINVY